MSDYTLLFLTQFKIELTRDLLNNLLISLDPTDKKVIDVSQQLDKYLNEYCKLRKSVQRKTTYNELHNNITNKRASAYIS